ncbi:hypothetical protein C4D60_Mb05t16400 [Musa balbisiana]|uniref:Uncharacterized protein n=1 Tax=Musa balbisiana TaxID=52838 RepID=A0A4S8JWL2_MUSBA|nr:hypothetical protein C4D60_Mb05t16400 [Musa balbisiana]
MGPTPPGAALASGHSARAQVVALPTALLTGATTGSARGWGNSGLPAPPAASLLQASRRLTTAGTAPMLPTYSHAACGCTHAD